MARGGEARKGLLAQGERCPLDATVDNLVDAQHLQRAKALREVSSDQFGIGDDVAHHDARNQPGMEIRLLEPCEEALAQLLMASCQQVAMESELLGVRRIGAKQGVDVLCVVGIQLSLNDRER